LPFIVLYWLVPFWSNLTIGNDYPVFSIQHQMELQFSLTHGSFPLYAPGFAGGRSAAALTLGQMYHPLSYLSSHSPGYWKGYALDWNTLWRLVSLGATHFVLFNLLLRLKLRTDIAFIVSFLTVYNQRMLDMFRYGASLENYTAFLLLCAAITFFYIAPTRSGSLWIIGSVYLLICGGHPQIAYLGFLGAIFMCLIVPGVVTAIRPDIDFSSKKVFSYYLAVGLCFSIGILLASAYTFPFYFDFLQDAPTRVGQPYKWSLAYSDNWIGELSGCFNPLHSDVHGAFGGSPLILIAVLVPIILIFARGNGRRSILCLWLLFVAVFLCSIGSDTPVHYFFWHYFPLANSFRTPGRIAMLLLPIFMFILAWFFRSADNQGAQKSTFRLAPWQILLPVIVVFLAGSIFWSRWGPGSGLFTPSHIQDYPAPTWVDSFIFWSSLGCLLLLMARLSQSRTHMLAGVLLGVMVVFQSAIQLRYGTWITERTPTISLEQMNNEKHSDLSFRGSAGYGMGSSTSMISSRAASRLATFYSIENNIPLSGWISFLSTNSNIIADTTANMATPGMTSATNQVDRIETTYVTFNRIVFQVDVHQYGFLIFSVPFSSQWIGIVDSHVSKTYQTDQKKIAVLLPAGIHTVDFQYRSQSSVVGMLITCFIMLLIGLYFSQNCLAGWMRIAVIGCVIFVSLAGFILWKHSLYNGEDLGTRYVWTGRGSNH